jgi:hypothetical protein
MHRVLLFLAAVLLVCQSATAIHEAFGAKQGVPVTLVETQKLDDDDLCVYISSSPRGLLDLTACTEALVVQTINSLQSELHVKEEDIVVLFDGRGPNVDDATWEAFQYKIRRVRTQTHVQIVEYDEWLHQGEGLHRAMESCTKSLVFSIQDDTAVRGPIDVAGIKAALFHDHSVEYVKLWWHKGLTWPDGKDDYGKDPHIQHKTVPFLYSTRHWSDRPHFATKRHYDSQVWPSFKGGKIRSTMEFTVNAVERRARERARGTTALTNMRRADKNLWVYFPEPTNWPGGVFQPEPTNFQTDVHTAGCGAQAHSQNLYSTEAGEVVDLGAVPPT